MALKETKVSVAPMQLDAEKASADANDMNNIFFYIYIYQIYSLQFLKINLYLLMHYNIIASIISDKQIRKRTKLFKRSVQLIECQVLSTDLRGYRGEFLI